MQTFNKDIQSGISKQINHFVEKMQKTGEHHTVTELGELVREFYSGINEMITTQPSFIGNTVITNSNHNNCNSF